MPNPEEKIVYQTTDGLRFDLQEDAERWQMQLDIDPGLGEVGVWQPKLTVDSMGYPEELPSDVEPK